MRMDICVYGRFLVKEKALENFSLQFPSELSREDVSRFLAQHFQDTQMVVRGILNMTVPTTKAILAEYEQPGTTIHYLIGNFRLLLTIWRSAQDS